MGPRFLGLDNADPVSIEKGEETSNFKSRDNEVDGNRWGGG